MPLLSPHASADVKAAVFRMLGYSGLLLPVFRGWETMRSVGVQTTVIGIDGLPLPPLPLLIKAVGTTDPSWFFEGGQLAKESILASLQRAGVKLDSLHSVLDFGCGCGRVLRTWHGLGPKMYGSDLNPRAVAWCRKNLPFVNASANSAEPPLHYVDSSFDFIYSLSVFTHLTVDGQFAWLDEFHRVLRPGGHLLITLHGEAYASRLRPDELKHFNAGECVVRRAGVAGSNLCSTFHPHSFFRNRLPDGWTFIEHVPRGARGNPEQDILLLKKCGE